MQMVEPCLLHVYSSSKLICLPSVNGTVRLQIIVSCSNAAVPKLLGPTSRISELIDLEWGLKFCFSN